MFCQTPDNCYHICTYCYAIVRKIISAHIGRPLSHCWRCHHHFHGCCIATDVAATIVAVTIAAAAVTATAAAVSAATTTVSAGIVTTFWLIIVCPCAASAFATVSCPHCCTFANLLAIVGGNTNGPATKVWFTVDVEVCAEPIKRDQQAPIKMVSGRAWSSGIYQDQRILVKTLDVAWWERVFIHPLTFNL